MNIQDLVRDNVKQLKPYASARDEYKNVIDDMIFLDANENPFYNGINRYPDPQQTRLKSILSTQRNISIDNILIGNGSDEVLDLIFRTFCEPNQDNIITLPPTYGMYEVLANINAVDILKVPLSNVFQPFIETIIDKQNNNSKLLFICSPNNPTANSFDKDKIELLINNFKGLVVIDEAYIDFSEQESWLCKLNEFPNLIITQTLSKAYGMAGIRLGICYASAEIISVLNKIKPPYNVNALTQQKAIEQLLDDKIVERQIELLKAQRKLLQIELKSISFVQTIYPSDANFLLVKVDDASKRYNQLLEKGIVIRSRSSQHLCENCIRITVGTPQENKELINTLKILT